MSVLMWVVVSSQLTWVVAEKMPLHLQCQLRCMVFSESNLLRLDPGVKTGKSGNGERRTRYVYCVFIFSVPEET